MHFSTSRAIELPGFAGSLAYVLDGVASAATQFGFGALHQLSFRRFVDCVSALERSRSRIVPPAHVDGFC